MSELPPERMGRSHYLSEGSIEIYEDYLTQPHLEAAMDAHINHGQAPNGGGFFQKHNLLL